MFKKLTSIILIFVMILSFAGCSQTDSDHTAGDNSESGSPSTDESNGSQEIETDENLLTVEITLPASFYEGQDMTTFDTEAYVKEQGFISAKVNEDGSVTVTMTKGKHKELLKEMAASLDETLSGYVNSAETPYVKEISHNEDFTIVIIKVDRAAYESAFDMMPFIIGFSAGMYQMFLDMESRVEIVVVDAATGETIKTTVYPDALQG